MSYYDEKSKARKDLKDYMETKYGSAYMSALKEKDIPSYIDFETNTFYYNKQI